MCCPPSPPTILRDCMGFDNFRLDKFTENSNQDWPFIYIRFISYLQGNNLQL